MDTDIPTISFPGIRGIQANQVYYVAMWTYGMMQRVTIFEDNELESFDRIQRNLNSKRVPEIKDYILNNRDTYVFSALTASIDKNVAFEPINPGSGIGQLKVSLNSKFIINDGQHRRKAILEAIAEDPTLATETIAVVFFVNTDTKRSQQMFADLNGKGVKTGKAINTLFDHRSHFAKLSRDLVSSMSIFRRTTDYQKTSLARRSKKLFTYSNIVGANIELMKGAATTKDLAEDLTVCRAFWETVAKIFPEWKYVAEDTMTASDVRDTSIAPSGVVMHAIGRVGNELLIRHRSDWKKYLAKLSSINWSRNNPEWEDRVLIQGKISKSNTSILLASAFIKQKIGIEPDTAELSAEANSDFRI
jgi:DNA sulfur modification protein DndB